MTTRAPERPFHFRAAGANARRRAAIGFTIRALIALLVAFSLMPPAPRAGSPGEIGRTVPELARRPAEHWINSTPLTLESLRGNVVVMEIWTFG